jgi:hypothetical protein
MDQVFSQDFVFVKLQSLVSSAEPSLSVALPLLLWFFVSLKKFFCASCLLQKLVVTVVVADLVYFLPAALKERGCSHYRLLSGAQNVTILWHETQKTLSSHLDFFIAGIDRQDPVNNH